MTLIACVDDNNTMLFVKRRVSMDRAVILDILDNYQINDEPIFMSEYSSGMFPSGTAKIIRSLDELLCCSSSAVFFAEMTGLNKLRNKVNRVVLYNWNRRYPNSVKFDFDLTGYSLVDSQDFKGYSHEKITREVYEKC